MLVSILLVTALSAVITFGLVPPVMVFAKKYKLVDDPRTRPHPAHTHKGIIPRAGGVAIFIGIAVPLLLFLPLQKTVVGILFGALVLILVGLWDDKKDRSPYFRIITNCISALFAIGVGVGIPYITSPFGGVVHLDMWRISFHFIQTHSIVILADIVALVWIVWTTNIIGWSGGVDGQLPGFVAISAFVIGLQSLRFATTDPLQVSVTYLSFVTAGAFLGFLPWNFFPQKIMPGYGGKTLAGYMLAVTSILSFSKLGTALLVLAVPMTDAVFMLLKRLLSGKSPMMASSGHLHHHLLALGWGKRKIALFYWSISAITGIIALLLTSKQKIFAEVLIFVCIVGFIALINLLRRFSKQKETEEF